MLITRLWVGCSKIEFPNLVGLLLKELLMRTGYWFLLIAGLFLVGGLLAFRTNLSNTQARAYEATFTAQPVGMASSPAAPVAQNPSPEPAETEAAQPPPETAQHLPLPTMASPVGAREAQDLHIDLEIKEVTALLDEDTAATLWTFGGTVPGPMLRVRQGDMVELRLVNPPDSLMPHSIDLHAVTGPGGGATVTQIGPGQDAVFKFQALNPGVYVYHCATPMIPMHIANGMYGLIVVEPPGGLPPVDREYYVMQSDYYLDGGFQPNGLRSFSIDKLNAEEPDFVLFNGSVGALSGANALKANVGETVRIFFGVGGPNLVSSFHVIGEIFDRVFVEGGSLVNENVQTTLVPAGGAVIVEFTVQVPGNYLLVDHSLGRLNKGAVGILVVEGPEDPSIFEPIKPGNTTTDH
jgi:nitrite reductase (NO-forming)